MGFGFSQFYRWLFVGALAGLATGVAAQNSAPTGGMNSYGFGGLVDMPSAWMPEDGELSFTLSSFAGQRRGTITFQVTPRLSASFRYSQLQDVRPAVGLAAVDDRFDRSFSLRYRLADEGRIGPAVVVGLNDFVGTGFYGSEYVVASKSLTPRLRVTGGLGWGRLGSEGGFRNPLAVLDDGFATRTGRSRDFGGQLELDNLFRGDAALFGGLSYRASDRLRLMAEYSSDAYPNEDGVAFDRRSPLNLGLSYRLTDALTLNASYLHGAAVGAQMTYALNGNRPLGGTGIELAPYPALPREQVAVTGWTDALAVPLSGAAATALAEQGIELNALRVTGGVARAEIVNRDYPAAAEAVGRAARTLTHVLPTEVTRVDLVLIENGIAVSEVSLNRADLERFEHALDGADAMLARARIGDAARPAAPPREAERFTSGFAPYAVPSYFDPEAPLRVDAGVAWQAGYRIAPGLFLSGTLRQRLIGTRDQSSRPSTSFLPRVRSESNLYAKADTTLYDLSLAYFFRPGGDLFGRVSLGYLEPQFAGLSTELLWKPNASRLAFGAEVNYVAQRAFDQRLGLRDYEVATGHVSAYWDLGNGFHTQIDVGRYLASDWGATLAIDRQFENGFTVGAFATLTDVSFDAFGEGSFDKGIRIEIPLAWLSGQPRRDTAEVTLRPVLRDGGARLNVDGRLYEMVRPLQGAELRDNWGRFWR